MSYTPEQLERKRLCYQRVQARKRGEDVPLLPHVNPPNWTGRKHSPENLAAMRAARERRVYPRKSLDPEGLREWFYIDAADVLRWRKDGGGGNKAHSAAGLIGNHGYRVVGFARRRILAHRIVWAITYGRWPRLQIDHINGIRDDNRLANLREATARQNVCNTPARKSSKSGIKGVSQHGNRWRASISLDGKTHRLGTFATAEEASAAYADAAQRLHGEFARWK